MEMILRFFAFLYDFKGYTAPMKNFLNRYMARNKNLKYQSEKDLGDIFDLTTQTILTEIGEKAFRPKRSVNAAVVDSLMTGIAKRLLVHKTFTDLKSLRIQYNSLIANTKYQDATETGTSQPANIITRFTEAEKAFSQIQ
jgi:hypothetical protein